MGQQLSSRLSSTRQLTVRNTGIPTASSYSAILRSRSDVSRVAKPSRSDVEHSPLLSRSGSQTLRNELTAMEDRRPTVTEQTAEPTTGAVLMVSARPGLNIANQ